MTLKQFLVELGKLKKRAGWTTDSKFGNFRPIRLQTVCPISAVANKKARRIKFGSASYYQAGEYLGLNIKTIDKIARAADRDDIAAVAPLRRKMLNVLNLGEAA